MNVDPDMKRSCFLRFFLATINSFTLSMAPLLCNFNCMFDHVTGHLTKHTCDMLLGEKCTRTTAPSKAFIYQPYCI